MTIKFKSGKIYENPYLKLALLILMKYCLNLMTETYAQGNNS